MSTINRLKEIYSNYINRPLTKVLSSQTLYEALLSNINMYKCYGDMKYYNEAINIGNRIVRMQLSDGGFDIGYNFYFGQNIKKDSKIQATTPEVLSIYALIELYKLTKDGRLEQAINKGMGWIRNNIFVDREGFQVISYAPQTINYVHITNCISFCIGTIANYSATFRDNSFDDIYHSMCRYMKKELSYSEEDKAYWLYFEKRYFGQGELYSKVDNYHIAQQLYYHCAAQEYIYDSDNEGIINLVGNYLGNELQKNVLLPYMIFLDTGRVIENCDIWGYSALLLAMLKMGYPDIINQIKEVLVEDCWKNDHFVSSISLNYEILDSNYYPRSDAWVLHALSESLLRFEDGKTKEIVECGLEKLAACQYIGAENHALTYRKEFGRYLKVIYRRLKNRG